MNGVKIDVRYDPSPEEKALIVNGLVAFNESKVGDARFKEFGIFASGESESIVAGLLGFMLWNGCFISMLWVAECHRSIQNRPVVIESKPATFMVSKGFEVSRQVA